MREQAGKCREPDSNSPRLETLVLHGALPRDNGCPVDSSEVRPVVDAEPPDEVGDGIAVRPTGVLREERGEPDVLLGDGSEEVEHVRGRERAVPAQDATAFGSLSRVVHGTSGRGFSSLP